MGMGMGMGMGMPRGQEKSSGHLHGAAADDRRSARRLRAGVRRAQAQRGANFCGRTTMLTLKFGESTLN